MLQGVEQPRTVDMHRQFMGACEIKNVLQGGQGIDGAAAVVRGVFQHDQAGAGVGIFYMTDGCREGRRCQNAVFCRQGLGLGSGDKRHGTGLEIKIVAVLLDQYDFGGFAPHGDGALPRHGGRGKKQRRLAPEILRHSQFQFGDAGVLAVGGIAHLSCVDGAAHPRVGQGEGIGAKFGRSIHVSIHPSI